jgi:hypothetical protein
MKVKTLWKEEKGAISIEFLGILPFFFMFFLLLWQVVGTGYAVFTAKTAVNDAAKTYAATDNIDQAIHKVQETIGDSNVLEYKSLDQQSLGNGHFKLVLQTDHYLTFVPDKWRRSMPFEFEMEAYGKVLMSS